MNSSDLYNTFRSDVVDVAKPYLWSDDEVWGYMNDAYRMFVRLTGGVADFTSDVCAVSAVAGEPLAALSPSILRIMSATRRSDFQPIEVINSTDIAKMRSQDYGQVKRLLMDNSQGVVRYMVQGMKPDLVRWVQIPAVADTIDLVVYRMPIGMITGDGQEFTDVDPDHHLHLLDWMKYLAYKKHDADTFDPQASASGKAEFEDYCSTVKSEWERYKHKTRVVSYGGL